MAQPPKKKDELQPQPHPLAGTMPGAVAGMDKITGGLPDYGGARAAAGQPTLQRAQAPAPASGLAPGFHSPVQPNVPQPVPDPPGTFARGAFDVAAQANDAVRAPMTAVFDGINRAGMGLRNFVRQGLGQPALQPTEFNYHPTQDRLAAARAANTAPAAAPAAAAAAPAAAAPTLTRTPVNIIDPTNPASMAMKPPAPAAPAAAGAAVASPASVASAGTVPAATLRPGDVNTFTGSDHITRAVPGMTAQPGTAAATGPVNVPVVATGTPAGAPVNPGPVAAPQVAMPSLVNPRTLSGDLTGAEKERQGALGDLDSALFDLRGNLNNRSRREMFVDLLRQKGQLTRDRVGQVTDLEKSGAGLDAQAAQEQARLQAEAADQNAERTQRGSIADQGATLRRYEIDQQGNEAMSSMKGEDGNSMVLRRNGSVTPITDANGKPFREQEKSGSISDGDVYSAYNAELKSINENTLLKPEERAARIQELESRPEVAAVLQKLRPQAAAGKAPTQDEFMAAARKAPENAKYSDAELQAFYKQKYGG